MSGRVFLLPALLSLQAYEMVLVLLFSPAQEFLFLPAGLLTLPAGAEDLGNFRAAE